MIPSVLDRSLHWCIGRLELPSGSGSTLNSAVSAPMFALLLLAALGWYSYQTNCEVDRESFTRFYVESVRHEQHEKRNESVKAKLTAFMSGVLPVRTPRFELRNFVVVTLAATDSGETYVCWLGRWFNVTGVLKSVGSAGAAAAAGGRSVGSSADMDGQDAAAQVILQHASNAKRERNFGEAARQFTSAAQEYSRLARSDPSMAYEACRAYEQAAASWKVPSVNQPDRATRAMQDAVGVIDVALSSPSSGSLSESALGNLRSRKIRLADQLGDIHIARDPAAALVHWRAALREAVAASEPAGMLARLSAKCADAVARSGDYASAANQYRLLLDDDNALQELGSFRMGELVLGHILASCAAASGEQVAMDEWVRIADNKWPGWSSSREREFLEKLGWLISEGHSADQHISQWKPMLQGWKGDALQEWLKVQSRESFR